MRLPLPLLMWYARRGPLAPLRRSALRKIARQHNGVEQEVALTAGFRMHLRLGDPVDTALAVTGDFEPQLTTLISRLAPRLPSFVDVGCNIGYFTCLVRSRNAGVPVVAIDANPRMIARARANAERNAYQGIAWENVGIGAEPGTLTLHVNDERPSQASFGGASLSGVRAEEVRVEPLPQVLARHGIGRVGLLKIDIEGFEPALFQGLPPDFMPRLERLVFEFQPAHLARCGFPPSLIPSLPWWSQYRCFGLDNASAQLVPLETAQFLTREWDSLYAERRDLPSGDGA
jgi:FkbM family methyltransferase